ncbi:MAG: hypothetical protein M0R76_11930 [Proteobacteria bacterium]|nr:hypothetical protein [Pseudomonadota bacterium]
MTYWVALFTPGAAAAKCNKTLRPILHFPHLFPHPLAQVLGADTSVRPQNSQRIWEKRIFFALNRKLSRKAADVLNGGNTRSEMHEVT